MNHFLFDFETSPLWFTEITNQSYNDDLGCYLTEDYLDVFTFNDCLGFEIPALPNLECLIEKFHLLESGISPMGCEVDELPALFYYDVGHGCEFEDLNGKFIKSI